MESLYRKYRPQTFDDVVGQKHVVATLRRAVLEGRTSHAYLFCGPRGTGKTTMARLLAKALLCEQGEGHLPDGTCEQCQLIAAGEHPDVYELDAASNTGVDNVREEIINRVSYAPVRGAFKVYIIDEVHMLTTAAFNALLKTLEEPPSHVVFILCTTDPQKVLETILSRVQRFDFHAISNPELLERLRYVCEQEQIEADADALALIARHARGGMRDALTKLEQLATATSGKVSFSAAQALLGEVSASTLSSIVMALAQRDIASLFSEVGSLVAEGHDLLQFAHELSARLRDAYVLSVVGPQEGVIDAQGDDLRTIAEEAEAFGVADRISRALAILADATTEMRVATNQRLVLEVALTRIARPESDVTMDALAERLAVLERRVSTLAAGGTVRVAPAQAAAAQVPTGQPASQEPARSSQASGDVSAEDARVTVEPAAAPTTQPAQAPRRVAAPRPAEAQVRGEAPQPHARAAAPAPAAETPAQSQRAAVQPERVAQRPAAPAQPTPVQPAAPAQPAAAAATQGVTDPGDLQRRWQRVCENLLVVSQPRGALLRSSDPVSDDGTRLLVSLPKGSGFSLKMLDRADVRSIIDPIVEREFGRRHVVYVEAGKATPAAAPVTRAAAPQAASRPAMPAQPTSAAQVGTPHPGGRAPQEARVAHEQPQPAAPGSAPQPQAFGRPQQPVSPRPVPGQPANELQPQTPSMPKLAVQPQVPVAARPEPTPQPSYPAPWDDLPPYEDVPYDDSFSVPLEDYWDEGMYEPATMPAPAQPTAPVASKPEPQRPSSQAAGTYAQAASPAPAAPVAPTPAPHKEPAAAAPAPRKESAVEAPAPRKEPAAAAPVPVDPAPVPSPGPAGIPEKPASPAQEKPASGAASADDFAASMLPGAIDGDSLAAMLTAAFGEGVNITIEPPHSDVDLELEEDDDEYDPNEGYTDDPDEYDEY